MTITKETRCLIQQTKGRMKSPEAAAKFRIHRNTVLRIWHEEPAIPWNVFPEADDKQQRIIRAIFFNLHPEYATEEDRKLHDAIIRAVEGLQLSGRTPSRHRAGTKPDIPNRIR